MPGLKELSSFRANLQNIADEENITTQWKERYEEYPFPKNPPAPDVDVDDLLGGIDLPPQDTFSMPEPDLSFEKLPSIADSIASDEIDDDKIEEERVDNGLDDVLKDDFEIPSISDSENMENFEGEFGSDTSDFGVEDSDVGGFEAPPAIGDIDIDDMNEGATPEALLSDEDEESSQGIEEDMPARKAKKGKIDMEKWNAQMDDISSSDDTPPMDNSLSIDDPFSNDEPISTNESADIGDDFNFAPENFSKVDQIEADDPLSDFDFPPNEDFASVDEKATGDDFATTNDVASSGEASPIDDSQAMNDASLEKNSSSSDYIAPPLDDFLPPFDESIKDDSNAMDFSATSYEDPTEEDNSLPEGVELSQGEDSAGEDDVYDFADEDFPSVKDSDDGFKLPDSAEDEFDGAQDDLGLSSNDLPSLDDATDETPLDTSMDGFTNDNFETEPLDESKDDIEAPQEILEQEGTSVQGDESSPTVDLDSFDFDMCGTDDVASSGEKTEDEEIGSLDAEPLDVLDSEDDGLDEIKPLDLAEPIEAADPLDMDSGLDDVPEIDEVEDLGDELQEAEGVEDLEVSPSVDEPPEMDFYTEPLDDVSSPATSKSTQSMPNEFDSFGNIDISAGGDESVIDDHSAFDLGDNPLEESISDTMGGGFSLPEDYTQFTQEKGYSAVKKAKSSDEEDISLTISDDEYQVLLDRISSFPLNVRLEIEDYLAHNDDTALSKMDLVHFIVGGAKLKKIAAKLSEILDKPIQIPKGFEKRSAEEREAEKRTFKWKLRNRIIPFATIASIIVILLSCISFLTWMFVYLPIVSETIYNKGYALLNENKYDNAMSEFERAGTYKMKKRWYFKYAEALREKKQFKLAEDVYKWLLIDFNHDKKAGLDYVSMLRDELHNYERAETVLRRQVLDYHVNDESALISLGDTYLEWARQKPEQYEKARQTYSQLINMYGTKDVFLSRMMKYFIRTDNLKEVLPLKEHFVSNLKKLELPELTELGSYLVAKRYEDDGSTPDYLNESIDDVRDILESALKRDEENADANYNMGRFFLYNRKPDVSQYYLMKSIERYRNTNNLSSESLMNNINAMRLYGEILTDKKEYLQAQEAYAEALGKYQEYSENKLLSPNKMVGKLYQDYGDVNYFISGDLNKALMAYTQAIGQMNDSPSLRYRIAYIHYQNKEYEKAMQALIQAHSEKQKDKNLLYGLGNTMYKRGSYDVAQGYYERLMEILEAERIRKDVILPHAREDHKAFVDEYMRATNNLAVILNKLSMQSGSSEKNGRAMFLFGESSKAWDTLTRNQQTMVASKAVSLAYLNTRNVLKPSTSFEAEIYSDIPKTLEGEQVLQNEVDK